jgi:hypothetical protein
MVISVKLCSGRTGFEVITKTRIDLMRASKIIKTKVATKHLILLNYRGVDVSVFPSGRMIIKTHSKEESLDIARHILAELGLLHSAEKQDQKHNKTIKQ